MSVKGFDKDDPIYTTLITSFGEKQVNIRLSGDFKEKCEESAKSENISFNEWVRRAMADRLSSDLRESLKRLTMNLDKKDEIIANLRNELTSSQSENKSLNNTILVLNKDKSDLENKLKTVSTELTDKTVFYKEYIDEIFEELERQKKYKKESDMFLDKSNKEVERLIVENERLNKKLKRTSINDQNTMDKLESVLRLSESPAIDKLERIILAMDNNNLKIQIGDSVFCSNCGSLVSNKDTVCKNCGAKILK